MRLGVIGIDGKGLAIAGNGLLLLALVLQRNAKVAVRLSVIGLDGKCLGDQINGSVILAHLVGDHT